MIKLQYKAPSSARAYWLLFGLAGLSFLLTLPVEYIGQESVYPLMSYEMWFRGQYLAPVMYGTYYWRPPLYNLMIIPVAQLLGWDHMLIAARIVALTATISSALLLAWFARRLSGDKTFSAFAALVYITLSDVLFYRGWLCFSEPVFSLFVLASIVFGWLALVENRYKYLAIALLAASAGFLTKALSAYIFYAVVMIVVAYRRRSWAFLFSWKSLFLNGLALMFPIFWYHSIPAGDLQSHGMLHDFTDKLVSLSAGGYLKHLYLYVVYTLVMILPVGGVLAYAFIRNRDPGKWRTDQNMVTALIIALVNFVPYFLAPISDTRYVCPLLPLVGLIFAYLIFYGAPSPHLRELSVKWIIAAVVLKFTFGLLGFPFFHQQSRASFEPVAKDIVRTVGTNNLYGTDMSGTALSVAAHIDRLIYPRKPLSRPPAKFDNGFVISYWRDENMGTMVKKYAIGRDEIYLRCKGTACMSHE